MNSRGYISSHFASLSDKVTESFSDLETKIIELHDEVDLLKRILKRLTPEINAALEVLDQDTIESLLTSLEQRNEYFINNKEK